MPSHLTKSQRKANRLNAKAKKNYQDNKRKQILNMNNLWHYNFIGSICQKDLYKCYKITP